MISNQIADSTIKNYLKLFYASGDVDVQATLNFLEISLTQLAEVFGYTKEQVRIERMSPLVKEKVKQLAAAAEFVAEAFNGNVQKTKFWFKTPNPNFGGSTPRDLIIKGRYKKVLDFILAARKIK